MTNKRKIAVAGLIALIGLTIYLFLFGKLFPYSPVIIGFEKHELLDVIVYSQKGVQFNDYQRIDSLIPPVEKFHDLKYLRKPKIFLFADSIDYIRRSVSKARFCAFYNGRVFATPWALKEGMHGKISLEIYLAHELSHSLIHQHSGLINASRYPKWLMEGIAVYSSNQMGTTLYPGKKETYQLIQSGNFMHPDYYKTRSEDKIQLKVKNRIAFMYSEFACIVDYLITVYGKDKFIVYFKSLTNNTNNDKIFKEIYKIDFDEFLINFKQFVTETNNQSK